MVYNYEHLIRKISQVAGLTEEEIDRRVEAKRAKLSGLISKEGAAQIIAAELGISFDKEKLKISELAAGMKKVNLIAKVLRIFPSREFTRNGKTGKVLNLLIADDSGNTRLVLWDTNHIDLFEKGEIKEGDSVEVANASTRDNEVHLGSFSELKLSSESFEKVITEKVVRARKLSEIKAGEAVKVRAFVLQLFDPRFFEVCPECKKKLSAENGEPVCVQHGRVMPEKRMLVNIILDDGSGNIRAVLFNDPLKDLGISVDNIDSFISKKAELEGSEFHILGNVRQNKMFNNLELSVDKIENIDVDSLIKELEVKRS